MKKINNKGFTLVETLLIILIVLITAFGGYFILQNISKNKKPKSDTTQSSKTTEQETASSKQLIKSYTDCIKSSTSKKDDKNWPLVCTTAQGLTYSETDPTNFAKVQQTINLSSSPYATTDIKKDGQDGYCYTPYIDSQPTAKLTRVVGIYALVDVVPTCGDVYQLTYAKNANGSWLVLSQNHLGLCFNSRENENPGLIEAIKALCN